MSAVAADNLISLRRAQLILGESRYRILSRVATRELDAEPVDGRVYLVRTSVERLASEKRGEAARIAAPA